jgi:hypothetical protein
MTANAEIPYTKTTQGGIMVAELVTLSRQLKEKADRIQEKISIITGGDTPANLEGASAFFGVGSGAGSDFNTYVGSVCAKIAEINDGWLARLDAGG